MNRQIAAPQTRNQNEEFLTFDTVFSLIENTNVNRRSGLEGKNKNSRCIEVTWSAGAPVQRYDWVSGEVYIEELVMDEKSVRLDRLNAGAPVLDMHQVMSSVDRMLAVVESAWVENGEGRAIIRFPKAEDDEDADRIFRKVKDGIITRLSCGYRRFSIDKDENVSPHVWRVTDWEPFEISFVSVPADISAKTRHKDVTNMKAPKKLNPIEVQETQETQSDTQTSVRELVEINSIRNLAAGQGISQESIGRAFDGVRDVDGARGALLGVLAQQAADNQTSPHQSNNSQHRDIEPQIVDALSVRLGAEGTLEDNPLVGLSTGELARTLMEANGVSTRNMRDRDVIDQSLDGSFWAGNSRAAHTTSDFPSLLLESGNRALLQRFGAELTPLKRLSRKRNAKDFRPQQMLRAGEAPKLKKVAEDGEITRGTMEAEKNVFQLEEYARIFALSRKAIINDDLDAFGDYVRAFAESSATTEGDLFFELLSDNSFAGKELSDGTPLFHTDRGNLAAAPATLDVDSLSQARMEMQSFKNVNGVGRSGSVPAVILVGPKMQTEAEQLVASLSPAQVSEVNPFSGKLSVEVETRYQGYGWWIFADPTTRAAFVHGYLDGVDGPQIESQMGWNIRGIEYRTCLDFGCGVQDWRAVFFNEGIDPNA